MYHTIEIYDLNVDHIIGPVCQRKSNEMKDKVEHALQRCLKITKAMSFIFAIAIPPESSESKTLAKHRQCKSI